MAYYDRDYYREPPRRGPSLPTGAANWSLTTWLIVINIAMFVIDQILGRTTGELTLFNWGHFSAATAIEQFQVWRFITFQFLHDPSGLAHIAFNMLALYFFGYMVERWLGSRRFIVFYLACGVAGAALYVILWQLGILVSAAGTPLVGASAGIFGILLGGARIAPNTTVMLLFPPIPMKLRTLAYAMVGLAAFVILFMGDKRGANAGGEAGHLGGALLGAYLIRNPHLLDFADRLFKRGGKRKPGGGPSGFTSVRTRGPSAKQQREIDRILDKVNREGMASLTNKEKRTLQKASEQQRGG